jgi:hypothetical protein
MEFFWWDSGPESSNTVNEGGWSTHMTVVIVDCTRALHYSARSWIGVSNHFKLSYTTVRCLTFKFGALLLAFSLPRNSLAKHFSRLRLWSSQDLPPQTHLPGLIPCRPKPQGIGPGAFIATCYLRTTVVKLAWRLHNGEDCEDWRELCLQDVKQFFIENPMSRVLCD